MQLFGLDFRALVLRNLGPKFGPVPKAKKYVFFPILDEKFPIWLSMFGSKSDVVVKYIENHLKLKK